MIKITCGTCGTSKGFKTSGDGEFTLSADEEKRLVSRGVAEYVTRPIIGADSGVATPTVPHSEGGGGNNTPDQAGGQKMALDGLEIPDVLDIVDGHFTVESLGALTNKALAQLSTDLGLEDAKACKNKADYVALLSSVELEMPDQDEGDDDEPPTPGAELPV